MKLYEYEGNIEVISGCFFLLISATHHQELLINCALLNGIVECAEYLNNRQTGYAICHIEDILKSNIITHVRDFCQDNDKIMNDFIKWAEKYAEMV